MTTSLDSEHPRLQRQVDQLRSPRADIPFCHIAAVLLGFAVEPDTCENNR